MGRHPLSREVRLVRLDRVLALLVPTRAVRCPTPWADRHASCLPSAPMPALAAVVPRPSELLPQCSSTSDRAAVRARNWRLWIWIVRLPRLRPCCSSTPDRNLIRTKPSCRRHPRWLGLPVRDSPKVTVVRAAPRLVCPRRETRTPHALAKTTLRLRKDTLAIPTAKAGSATRLGVNANVMHESVRTATGAAVRGSRARRSESRSRYSINSRARRIASILVGARPHPSILAMILVVVRRRRWTARWRVVRRTCQRPPLLVLLMATGIVSVSAARRLLGNIRPLLREMHLLRVRAVMIPGWILIPNHPGVSTGQRIKVTLLHTQPTARGTMRPLMAALPGVAIVDPSSPLMDPRVPFPPAALDGPSLRARRVADAVLPSLPRRRTPRRRAKRRSASRQRSAAGVRAVLSKTAKCRPPRPALLVRHPCLKPQHSRSISDKTRCLLRLCRDPIILARSLDQTDRVARVARLVPIWAHHVETSMRIMTKV